MAEGECDATSGELISNRTRVRYGAGKPVELGEDQRIAMANSGKRLIETGLARFVPVNP